MTNNLKNKNHILEKEIKKYNYLFENNNLYNANKNHPRYAIAEKFLKRCGKVKLVADIGCGRCIFFDMLQEKGLQVFGLEPSTVIVNSKKSPFVIQGTCDNIPFANNLFDVVFCLDVLEHIPGILISDSLKELHRISNNYLIISAASHEDIVENLKVHITIKLYPEWEKIISKYFKIVSSEMIYSKTYPGRTAKVYLCRKMIKK